MVANKPLEYYKLSMMGILVRRWKTRMLIKMWVVKARHRRFQLETRSPLAITPQAMFLMLWQKICPQSDHVLTLYETQEQRAHFKFAFVLSELKDL